MSQDKLGYARDVKPKGVLGGYGAVPVIMKYYQIFILPKVHTHMVLLKTSSKSHYAGSFYFNCCLLYDYTVLGYTWLSEDSCGH